MCLRFTTDNANKRNSLHKIIIVKIYFLFLGSRNSIKKFKIYWPNFLNLLYSIIKYSKKKLGNYVLVPFSADSTVAASSRLWHAYEVWLALPTS